MQPGRHKVLKWRSYCMQKKNTAPQQEKLSDQELIYQLEGRPSFRTAFPLGMQHVLCMFAANLAPILIIAAACGLSNGDTVTMVQCAMFVSGLTTFFQLYPIKLGKDRQIGAGLPIVMGTSFAFVPTACSIGVVGGIGAVLGGCMLGSLVEAFMGFFYKYIRRFFPPLVVGATLVSIGISLLGVGVDYLAGGSGAADYGSIQNMALGAFVFLIVILLQRFTKGAVKNSALLIALVIGYVVAICMGIVDFTAVQEAAWFSLPLPLQLKPTFSLAAVVSFAVLFVESGLETIGNTSGITIAGFDREATERETSGAILADALGSTTAAIFNALPNTAFGQNAGIVAMTRIVNKWCIAMGAFVLMIAGFLPKLGAIFSAIPSCVLGGALMTVFGNIMINGIKMIGKAGFSERNVLILAITFSLGLGLAGNAEAIAYLPSVVRFLFTDSVAATCIVAIIVNLIFPEKDEAEREKAKKALMDAD